ncbi:MAG TPA: polyprenyl synthetase family protein [Bacteroidetes bacterium]|nr:polyprenyl synthetase family protein [Bacteroidota bacterium]
MELNAHFKQTLTKLHDAVNRQLQAALVKKEPVSLYEPMRYTLFAGGKRLRPILLLLTTQAVGGNYRDALNAAVAVELLHNFTLIHDDVMDQDDTRRGQPTVHKKWDVDVAILSGDGLVALSYEYLLKTRYPAIDQLGQLFSRALLEVCEGQALDKDFESKTNVTPAEYFKMIQKKTAALLALCCELGAHIGGADAETIASLREFGLNLGMAFQIQDDLLDIISEEKQLGKTWGSDIKRKKKTLLLIQAKKLAGAANMAQIDAILNKESISTADVTRMKKIFEDTGAVEYSRKLLARHFRRARDCFKPISSESGKALLTNLLETVVIRTN